MRRGDPFLTREEAAQRRGKKVEPLIAGKRSRAFGTAIQQDQPEFEAYVRCGGREKPARGEGKAISVIGI
jgi:hypothetical protein